MALYSSDNRSMLTESRNDKNPSDCTTKRKEMESVTICFKYIHTYLICELCYD